MKLPPPERPDIKPCGGKNQRACCVGERARGNCDRGLKEVAGSGPNDVPQKSWLGGMPVEGGYSVLVPIPAVGVGLGIQLDPGAAVLFQLGWTATFGRPGTGGICDDSGCWDLALPWKAETHGLPASQPPGASTRAGPRSAPRRRWPPRPRGARPAGPL